MAFTPEEERVLKAIASGLLNANGSGKAGAVGKAEATDEELDGRFGDPAVRKDPKRWAGASYVGAKYSECPSDYLLVLAESLEYFADLDSKKADPKKHKNGTPYWQYNLKDAKLARGWARRNRGRTFDPPTGGVASDDGGSASGADDFGGSPDGEIPF